MSTVPLIYLLMGVTGSGKSTIGELLAEKLAVPFFDADDFHPAKNIEQMRKGIPLSDADRIPWLQAIRNKIEECCRTNTRAVFACSALKAKYRLILTEGLSYVQLIHLARNAETIADRLSNRNGHFMNPNLLPSQFEDLELPEDALTVSILSDPNSIVSEILNHSS